MNQAFLFLKTNKMKKINYTLILFFLLPFFLVSQNTSDLLVSVVEKLPDENMVIAQSTKIKNLELINSEQLDYSPVLYKNGVIFTSNRQANNKNLWNKLFNTKKTNLFYAEKVKDGTYKAPVPLKGKFDKNINEGAIATNDAGNVVIYAINVNKSKKPQTTELALYISELHGEQWSNGKELPINFKGSTTCHPSLSVDSKTLYFSSNRPGGFGGLDIYKSEFKNGTWGEPINLGSKINTPENELFPFINFDGTLFFSSNGKSGSENLDIYFSRVDYKGDWKEAINIGKPFNSSSDDFGFYIEKDGLSGLFSSNREGGIGMDDIYFWRIDQSLERALDPSPVRFTIVDDETGEILSNAEVTLIEFDDVKIESLETDGPIAFVSKINQSMAELAGKPYVYQTDSYGNIYHDLKHGKNYMLIVEKDDYSTFRKMTTYNLLSGIKDIDIALAHPEDYEPQYKTLIDVAATEEIDENGVSIGANPIAVMAKNEGNSNIIKEGQKITLDNIFYEFGKTELKTESTVVLDETVDMLNKFPEMEIDLIAHTDARGNANYNKSLSQQRADAARRYLIAKGIEKRRVRAIGLGEEMPLNDCFDGKDCSEDLHSINRRTEIVITKLHPSTEIFVKKE